jgi:hypothetical protein
MSFPPEKKNTSPSYRKTGKIMALYILMSMYLGSRRKDLRLYFTLKETPGIFSVYCLCQIQIFQFLEIRYYKTEA